MSWVDAEGRARKNKEGKTLLRIPARRSQNTAQELVPKCLPLPEHIVGISVQLTDILSEFVNDFPMPALQKALLYPPKYLQARKHLLPAHQSLSAARQPGLATPTGKGRLFSGLNPEHRCPAHEPNLKSPHQADTGVTCSPGSWFLSLTQHGGRHGRGPGWRLSYGRYPQTP